MTDRSFEKAIRELEQIAQKLENANLCLEESVDLYNQGKILYEYCNKTLESMKLKIEIAN